MAEKSTILIADNDKLLVDLLVRVWSSHNVSVFGTTSAEEAIRIVDVRVPDLLIVDPGILNGFSLIASVRTAGGDRVKVIALAATAELRTRSRAINVDRVVDRHRGLDALVEAIQKSIQMPLPFLEAAAAHILIADADAAVAAMLGEFLSGRGYTVSVAKSGKEAGDRVAADPGIQIVLLDVKLPDMSGMDMLRLLTSQAARPSVVMMTAVIDRELAREALTIGASDYVIKPFDFPAIEASIRKCSARPDVPWWKKLT